MKILGARWGVTNSPLEISANLFSPAEVCGVHVKLETADFESFGYAYCWHRQAARALVELGRMMSQRVIGTSVSDWQEVSAAIAREYVNFLGTEGMAVFVHSALDLAVWDLTLKAEGRTLQQTRGRPPRPAASYVSRDLWPNLSPAECRALAADMVADGACGVKIWVSGNEPTLQRDRVLAVRDALGPDRALFVDANQGFSPQDALAFAEAIADARPDWFEDPVHKDDLAGLGWLSERSPVPLASGENAYGQTGLKRLLDAAKLDAILIDLQRIGGISGWIEAEALCVAHDVRLSSHLFPEIGARLLAGSRSEDAIVEASAFFDSVFGPATLVDGEIVAETQAGATSYPKGVIWQ